MASFNQAAVATLNSLVSNASMLERSRQQKDRLAWQNIPKTQMYLNRLGVSLDDLDHKFKTVHIAGTKVLTFVFVFFVLNLPCSFSLSRRNLQRVIGHRAKDPQVPSASQC